MRDRLDMRLEALDTRESNGYEGYRVFGKPDGSAVRVGEIEYARRADEN